MIQKPIVCFDFDGTLVDGQGRIHPQDAAILRSERRVIFIPTTGRSLSSVRRAFEENGLFAGESIPFPMVLHNGAVVYLEGERVAAHTPFANQVQARLVEVCRRHPQACSIFFSLERLDVMHLNPQAQQQIERFHLDVQPFEDVGQQFTKITSVAARREPLEALAAEVQPLAVETSFSLPTVFEVNQAGVDKGVGLLRLLKLTGWGRERLVVAGDGENDLPLFPLARRVYCPAGSPEKIRELADVIVNVEKDGLLGAVLSGYACDGGF